MKKFLLLALCFFAAQINSCGSIEVQAEATKFTIYNRSQEVSLKDVTWNTTNFGNIEPGDSSTKEITKFGYSEITFKVNGILYNTYELIQGQEFRHRNYEFNNETIVKDGDKDYSLKDLKNEDTQYEIYNGSQADLRNVRWSNANFGDIESKTSSGIKIITIYGHDDIRLEVNGKEYYTYDLFESKKFRHSTHNLNDGTRVIDVIDNKTTTLGDLK